MNSTQVRASPTCAYLDDFWKELLGDSHPGTDEHAPEFGSGLFDMEDKREGAPGNTRALALERLAWACHRLLTLNEKGVDRSKDDFEFGRSFVPLKSVMKRGGDDGRPVAAAAGVGRVGARERLVEVGRHDDGAARGQRLAVEREVEARPEEACVEFNHWFGWP